MTTLLAEIAAELTRPPGDAPPICASTVRRWMRRARGEARGAVYSLLTNGDIYARVAPPLSLDEASDWLIKYFEWCLRTDPRGEWPSSRFEAAADLVTWFVAMWDEGQDAAQFVRIRQLLADLYVTGPPGLRRVIVQGCLEHLFERKEIMDFFHSWKEHPQLGRAYEQAALWASRGGKTPLSRRRRPAPRKGPEDQQ